MTNKLIKTTDFSSEDVRKVFELAGKVKANPEAYQNALSGKKLGLIFEKPSTRTWVSFDVGISSMGGGTIYLGPEDIQLDEREETRDVARVLDRYLAGVILRTFEHSTIEEFAKYFRGPVINGLSDFSHPCQALTDFFTIQERFSDLKEPLVAFVGDGNNVLTSLILVAALVGGKIHYSTPPAHAPAASIIEEAREIAKKTGAVIQAFEDPKEAVKDADFIYTDVWVSMGQEDQEDSKVKDFEGMQVNQDLLACAKANVSVMHCLPADRGREITDEVIESDASIVFDQAENRMHVQKAILLHLFGGVS